MLRWLFGRGDGTVSRPAGGAAGARDGDERPGADPVLPPTGNRSGVEVHAAAARAAIGASRARPGETRLGPLAASRLPGDLAWAAIVLSGGARGDVVFLDAGPPVDLPDGTAVLLDGATREDTPVPARVASAALVGAGVPGVTGARLLVRTKARALLRLGPPPAARWAVVGLRSVAVFTGKLTLSVGEEGLDVKAGEVALVSDPTATLHVQAGNDAAVAIAFASPGVVVRLE